MTGNDAISAIQEAHADLAKAFDDSGQDVGLMRAPCSYQWSSISLLLIVACNLAKLCSSLDPTDAALAASELRRALWTQEGCAEVTRLLLTCAANIRAGTARREAAGGTQTAEPK